MAYVAKDADNWADGPERVVDKLVAVEGATAELCRETADELGEGTEYLDVDKRFRRVMGAYALRQAADRLDK
jgi:hypothetical protein